jgi:hypothetical protein
MHVQDLVMLLDSNCTWVCSNVCPRDAHQNLGRFALAQCFPSVLVHLEMKPQRRFSMRAHAISRPLLGSVSSRMVAAKVKGPHVVGPGASPAGRPNTTFGNSRSVLGGIAYLRFYSTGMQVVCPWWDCFHKDGGVFREDDTKHTDACATG